MILEDLNKKNKKCVNCNKIFPENVGICEVCGSVDFVLINEEKPKEKVKEYMKDEPIEEQKEKIIEKTEKLKEEPTKNKKSDKNQKK